MGILAKLRKLRKRTSEINTIVIGADAVVDEGDVVAQPDVTYDPKTRDIVLTGHHGPVAAVDYSSDGELCVSGAKGHGNCIIIWDCENGGSLEVFHEAKETWCVRFCANDDKIVSGDNCWKVHLWDVFGAILLRTFSGHCGAVYDVAVNSLHEIASCSWDKTVIVWDATLDVGNKHRRKHFRGHRGPGIWCMLHS